MDRVNYVRGQVPPSADLNKAQEGAETAIDLIAKAVLAGEVIDGLDLDLAAGTISRGRGYDAEGHHIDLSAAPPFDLSAIARPGAGMVRWVSVALRWVREGSGDVYDRNNVQHDRYELDSSQVVLAAGAEDVDADTAARPDFGGDLLIADVLLDESTALDALDLSTTRRTEATRDLGELDRALRDLGDVLTRPEADARYARRPAAPAAPMGISTSALIVRFSWLTPDDRGSDIRGYEMQWRQRGDDWSSDHVVPTTDTQGSAMVPDATLDIEARVRARNGIGRGDWSPTGAVLAGEIETIAVPTELRFDMNDVFDWPYPNQSATLEIYGGAGGADGGYGSPGTPASSSDIPCDLPNHYVNVAGPTPGQPGTTGAAGGDTVVEHGVNSYTGPGGVASGGAPAVVTRVISGLSIGDAITIVIGDGGAGGQGGPGGSGGWTGCFNPQSSVPVSICCRGVAGAAGATGRDGAGGYVIIRPA